MTSEATLFQFLNSFGIPAYTATSVPDDAEFPYITYELATGTFWDGEVPLPVNIWYRGDSEVEPNAKARELLRGIGPGGKFLSCENGALWLKRGTPFSQAMGDPGDDKIKRRYISLTVEYITTD